MSAYSIEIKGDELQVAFGDPADNDDIVKDALERLKQMNDDGTFDHTHLVKINGPMSIPVAMVLALKLAVWCRVVACHDPKLDRYVVVASGDPALQVGDLV